MERFCRTFRTMLLTGLLPGAMSLPAVAQSFQPVRYADTPAQAEPERTATKAPQLPISSGAAEVKRDAEEPRYRRSPAIQPRRQHERRRVHSSEPDGFREGSVNPNSGKRRPESENRNARRSTPPPAFHLPPSIQSPVRKDDALWPVVRSKPAEAGRYVRNRSAIADDAAERLRTSRVTTADLRSQPGERPDVRHATFRRSPDSGHMAAPVFPAIEQRVQAVPRQPSRSSRIPVESRESRVEGRRKAEGGSWNAEAGKRKAANRLWLSTLDSRLSTLPPLTSSCRP